MTNKVYFNLILQKGLFFTFELYLSQFANKTPKHLNQPLTNQTAPPKLLRSDLRSDFLHQPPPGCSHEFRWARVLPLVHFWRRHTLGSSSVIRPLPWSYEEQMRIGGMKADQWWGDKPPRDGQEGKGGVGAGGGGGGEKKNREKETIGGTKEGAERGCGVTRLELG